MSVDTKFFTPFCTEVESFDISAELVESAGLNQWANAFKLGTAGYRDLVDPNDLFNLEVPFNGVTASIFLTARAQLAVEMGINSLHVGGEVRPHTQELINLAARIYAAAGIEVHLRPPELKTTPIWLSSFGVFYNELDGGENFTASHSQNFKGGWKPMSADGGQLLEMASLISDRVRALVAQTSTATLTIHLAASSSELIHRDFDPITPYVEALRKVVPAELLSEIGTAAEQGFKAAFCTEGGSMGATARRIFPLLDIGLDPAGPVFFTHEAEDSNYHGIGVVDGVNHGVDPGKWQVYKHVGAQELLLQNKADVFFIWDPDGDRFNMVTTAPAKFAQSARVAGLEVDPLDDDRCLVFFKPNQIYFMLTALKIQALDTADELDSYNWIVATTYPTSRSIGEVATKFNQRPGGKLCTFQTPVGFKYFAALVGDLEKQIDDGVINISATDVTGDKTEFGAKPRLLIMAEESGGAAMGPAEAISSRGGKRVSLAPKEKDGMQIGVMALCLAARLHRQQSSFAAYYLDRLAEFDTTYRFYERRDITLFDESLTGTERINAQQAGNERKEATVAFFVSLEQQEPAQVAKILAERMTIATAVPPIIRVFHAGDGTMIEFADQWFELRASGTDAVLRYYMEGRQPGLVSKLNEAFTTLTI